MSRTRSIVRVGAGVAALATVAATTSAVSAGPRSHTVQRSATAFTVNTSYADVAPDSAVVTLTLTDKTIKGLPKVLAPGWHTFVLVDHTKDGRDLDVVKVHDNAPHFGLKQFLADAKKFNSQNPHTVATSVLDLIAHAQGEGGLSGAAYYGGSHRKLMVNLTADRTYIFDNSSDNSGPENATLVTVSGAPTTVTSPKATGSISTHEYGFTTAGLAKGTHLLRIGSTGAEAHIVAAIKVPAGTTKDQVSAALSDPNAQGFPAGWQPWLAVSPMTHGGSFVAPVTFAPGTYAFICFMPELKSGPMQGAPHFLEGMIKVFTIS